MANTKEIKNRMKSVQDTQKITNAMYLIASTKLRKAKAELDKTRPYFYELRAEVRGMFGKGSVTSHYFTEMDLTDKPIGVLVVTADKGLAGAYNSNILKEAVKLIGNNPNNKLYVVGEVGRQYFMQRGIAIEQSFLYTAQNPTLQRARDIVKVLLVKYLSGEIGEIHIIYTDMVNSLISEPIVKRLVPFKKSDFDDVDAADYENLEFLPDMNSVLDTIMPSCLTGYVYSALVNSFCAEQNARMSAMNAANDNAQKLLDELSVEYNRVRQAAITQEITEVSAGAKAQKRKRMKEAANS